MSKRKLHIITRLLLVVATAFIMGCDDGDGDGQSTQPNALAGTWEYIGAELTIAVVGPDAEAAAADFQQVLSDEGFPLERNGNELTGTLLTPEQMQAWGIFSSIIETVTINDNGTWTATGIVDGVPNSNAGTWSTSGSTLTLNQSGGVMALTYEIEGNTLRMQTDEMVDSITEGDHTAFVEGWMVLTRQ